MIKDAELRIIHSDSLAKIDITEYENLQEKQRQGNVRERKQNELHREEVIFEEESRPNVIVKLELSTLVI